jgi:hypothetical protein
VAGGPDEEIRARGRAADREVGGTSVVGEEVEAQELVLPGVTQPSWTSWSDAENVRVWTVKFLTLVTRFTPMDHSSCRTVEAAAGPMCFYACLTETSRPGSRPLANRDKDARSRDLADSL